MRLFWTDCCPGGLLKLLLGVGKAYAALAQYDCCKAVQLFEELPEHQYNTAWVLAQIGRAYFERGDFQKVRCGAGLLLSYSLYFLGILLGGGYISFSADFLI